jgi:DNA-binding response OmpR family regulator
MANILVIDDEFGIAEAVAGILQDEGHRVRTASDGRQGLALVGEEPPDLILLDFMMPIVDGPMMLEQLSANERSRRIPVILMSAIEEDVVRRAVDGRTTFLHKPFEVDTLLEAVEQELR